MTDCSERLLLNYFYLLKYRATQLHTIRKQKTYRSTLKCCTLILKTIGLTEWKCVKLASVRFRGNIFCGYRSCHVYGRTDCDFEWAVHVDVNNNKQFSKTCKFKIREMYYILGKGRYTCFLV